MAYVRWAGHYQMYDYVVRELPALIGRHFPADMSRQGITGHSMGGHGALMIAVRNPGVYRSVSAFAPICAPMACPWGHKALGAYLGDDRDAWAQYDTCHLLEQAMGVPELLVDQGESDQFLAEQLLPERLEEVCRRRGHRLTLRRQPGYDHSYYFIATFIGDHLAHHAAALNA